ncbi:serine/threonine-protein kinase RsbW [Streptomyces sp. SAI-170]|uniref:ATP-binding protein n=1 Tax=unclassified Streptomyces TaxID=2593676 RepID=UPI00380FD21F
MAIDHGAPSAAGVPAQVARGGGLPLGVVRRATAEHAVSAGRIKVRAALEELDRVAAFVLDVGRRAGLNESALYRLRLAADELATNIVMHGYRGRSGEIAVEAAIEPERLWVRFQDDAPAFDPHQGMRAPELDAPLSERRIGGLGVYLAVTAVDEYRYELVAGRNVSTLVMLLPGRGGSTRPPRTRGGDDEPTAE